MGGAGVTNLIYHKSFTAEGDVYYYNEETDDSRWEFPKIPGAVVLDENGALMSAPDDEGPPIVYQRQQTDEGDEYYYCEATDDSKWEYPSMPGSVVLDEKGNVLPPPSVYTLQHTDDGDPYYHNTVTGDSLWEWPNGATVL